MLDAIEATSELCSLNLTCLTMGEEWLLIHRPQFDVVIREEPFQILQVIVHVTTQEYLIRLWGQTHERGSVGSLDDLKEVCQQTFQRTEVCLGLSSKLDASVRCVSYPTKRYFSKRCSKIRRLSAADESPTSTCSSCAESFRLNEPDDVSLGDAESATEIKLEEEEKAAAADVVGNCDESDFHADSLEATTVKEEESRSDEKEGTLVETKYNPEEYLKEGVSCKVCGQRYKHFGSLLRHEKKIHGKKSVSLVDSSQTRRNRPQQEERPRRVRNRHYVCEYCQKAFESKLLCLEHRTSHTGEKLFYCEECGKGFGFVSSYNYHIRSHLRQKGLVTDARSNSLYHYCEHCGKRFSDKHKMRQHIDVQHLNLSLQKTCATCGETCSNRNRLLEHVNKNHRSDPRYQCGTCGKRFGSKNMLDRHQLVHNEPQLQCKFCGKKVKKRENLLNHERIHTGEAPFTCPTCQLSFRSRPALCLHKRTHLKTHVAQVK